MLKAPLLCLRGLSCIQKKETDIYWRAASNDALDAAHVLFITAICKVNQINLTDYRTMQSQGDAEDIGAYNIAKSAMDLKEIPRFRIQKTYPLPVLSIKYI